MTLIKIFLSFYFKGNMRKKRNLRRTSKIFDIIHWQLLYKGKMLIIQSKEEKKKIIHDIYEGLPEDPKAKAVTPHCRKDSTYHGISNILFWYGNIERCKMLYLLNCKIFLHLQKWCNKSLGIYAIYQNLTVINI